jgi:hypothetical protein
VADLAWPPSAEDYYINADASRPVTQGDVFDDVPFAKNKRASKVTDDPNTSYERRPCIVLGYTCDLYTDAGTLAKVQVVAPVIEAAKVGIPDDWDGAFNFAPLPDLRGDGVMHAADLRAASNIDAFYLDRTKRVRCLSELGWAAFRQRLGLSHARVLNHLDDLVAVGEDVWREIALWERWNREGRKSEAFQTWLDQHHAGLGGFPLRALLYRGMVNEVSAALEAELAQSDTAGSGATAAKAVKKAPAKRAVRKR